MTKNICLILLITVLTAFQKTTANFAGNDNFTSSSVKSVFFELKGIKPVYPVMALNSQDGLILHFDVLSGSSESLNYKFIHCDSDWSTSDIFYNDFIEGFEENSLTSYGSSFNTKITYSHYRLELPNNDVKFKISGNYLLIIYKPGEEETPLLKRRILIHEGLAPLSVTFRRTSGKSYMTGQQPEISVALNVPEITDPYTQITLSIMQNGRWDMIRQNIKPDFIGNSTAEFTPLNKLTLFDGGNEFRFFDIKNIKQRMQNVRAIDFVDGNYHVFLLPSENRESQQHFFNNDLDGEYYIAIEGSDEPDLDADYVYVYFTLPSVNKIEGGDLYITGALTNWEYTPDNKMIYNPEKRCYEGVLLLKQGWYNYEYAFIPEGKEMPRGNAFEGSHYDTENNYLLSVYFNDPRQRYDRLLNCVVTGNSENKPR